MSEIFSSFFHFLINDIEPWKIWFYVCNFLGFLIFWNFLFGRILEEAKTDWKNRKKWSFWKKAIDDYKRWKTDKGT